MAINWHSRYLLGLVAAASLATAVLAAPPLHARQAATCTYEQKQARTQTLAAFKQGMAAARAAYFKKVKSPKLRAAFVKAQRKKLKTLQSAAACTVPPLPPSSNTSCSPQLVPRPGGGLSEGAIDPARRQSSTGRIDSIGLFLDYPDAVGNPSALATLTRSYAVEPAWWREVSNGRLSVSLAPDARWIRMPAPTTAYLPINSGESVYRYVKDAIAAADPVVDFSRYNHVTFWNAPGMNLTTGSAFILTEVGGAPPIVADGKQILYGVFLGPDVAGRVPNIWSHEQLHVLGLPDLGGRAVGWDTTSYANDPPGLTHLLGWHKWLLGWLDPPQLTCVSAPGTIEETLMPSAVADGKKLAVVPVAPYLAYAVEVRRRIGYDRLACGEGVLVYSIDSRRGGYEDPIVLLGSPRCGNVTPGAFQTGGVAENEHVKVEVLATDGRNYRVRVTKK
jgi:M6 family metalloprotease-like protein